MKSARLNSRHTAATEADERGAALRPLVISLIATLAGMSSGAVGLVLDNTAMMVAGMVLAGTGSVLVNLMAKTMNQSGPGDDARTALIHAHEKGQ